MRPLRAADVDLDYDAVMENPAALRLSGGGSWPADDFTRKANLADLIMHEQEHKHNVAFTYTLMNPGQDQCLGCVYINLLTRAYSLVDFSGPAPVGERQAVVRLWVRHSRVEEDLDWRLLQALIGWFNGAWSFSELYFRAHELDDRQRSLMTRAKLPQRLTLEAPGRRGPFFGYGPVGMSE